LTCGGIVGSKIFIETLMCFDNVENLDVIVVFTRLNNFKADILNVK